MAYAAASRENPLERSVPITDLSVAESVPSGRVRWWNAVTFHHRGSSRAPSSVWAVVDAITLTVTATTDTTTI